MVIVVKAFKPLVFFFTKILILGQDYLISNRFCIGIGVTVITSGDLLDMLYAEAYQ